MQLIQLLHLYLVNANDILWKSFDRVYIATVLKSCKVTSSVHWILSGLCSYWIAACSSPCHYWSGKLLSGHCVYAWYLKPVLIIPLLNKSNFNFDYFKTFTVSNLPSTSKVIEKVLAVQLVNYVNDNIIMVNLCNLPLSATIAPNPSESSQWHIEGRSTADELLFCYRLTYLPLLTRLSMVFWYIDSNLGLA